MRLSHYRIDNERCRRCSRCLQVCPHNAIHISAEQSLPFIDQHRCQRCGMCFRACRFGAVGLPRLGRASSLLPDYVAGDQYDRAWGMNRRW